MSSKHIYLTILIVLTACSNPKHISIDYHIHMTSPTMAKKMEKLCGTHLICDDGQLPSSNAADILKRLDNTFNRAVILSEAYFAGMPEMELDIETQKKLTRSENTYVAEQVSSSKKLYGFFSVNPLADYALNEAKYCIISEKFHGIKLHFGNSNFDYFNPQHIQKIKSLLQLIDAPSMNIMLHGRTRNPDFGKKDIQILINDIIPFAPKSTWVIAHAGGWGGYDNATDIALTTIIDALNSEILDKSKVYLDMSAMVVPEANKAGYPIPKDTLDAQTQKFITRFHSLPISNWLFGSDWVPHDNLDSNQYLNELLLAGFKEEELKTIVTNRLNFIE